GGARAGSGLGFCGTKGSLGISPGAFVVTADAAPPPVIQIPGVRDGHPAGGPVAVPGRAGQLRTTAIEDRSGSSDEQYAEHARNFLECVRTRKAPTSDLAGAHRVSVACHLANLSLRLGRSLRWDGKTASIPGDDEANRALVRPYRSPWDKELKALGVG